MKKAFFLFAACALMAMPQRSTAVELLTSGDFENPGGETGKVPGWELQEFLTGSSSSVETATLTGGTDIELFLHAFAGGGPLTPSQANFDNDGLPEGEVDGRDFLIWQRNYSNAMNKLPSQGDATGDMNVNGSDLSIWQSNYGTGAAGIFANARLRQSVPAVAGDTYTFQGTSTFEENYSGFVTTLGDASPHGQIASPTQTRFRMEFLNASNQIIGTPQELDLRTEQTFPGFPIVHTPLVGVAPVGTVNVRVIAEALNMAWNGSTSQGEDVGQLQSAFFNDFSLTRAGQPGTPLLTNGDLQLGTPSALDFWNQAENPVTRTEILRTAVFADHTTAPTNTGLGVWYSAFFGAHSAFEPDPVDGSISQTVQAVEGGTYNFSGWSRFEGGYSGGVDTICASSCGGPAPGMGLFAGMASPTVTEIELAFLDINEEVISASVIDVEADRKLQGAGVANDNQWRQHTFTGAVAPAGTEFVRISALMTDAVFNQDVGGALGNQSIFFDDFTLDGPASGLLANVVVPEPSSLVVLGLGALLVGMGRNRK